jgi:large subunit ribosomal protein L13
MGHESFKPVQQLLDKKPELVIEKAVFGMLPKNALSRQRLRLKLKVYRNAEHPHAAQQPKPFAVKVSA